MPQLLAVMRGLIDLDPSPLPEPTAFSLGMSGRGLSTMVDADSPFQDRRNLSVGQQSNTSNWSAMA